MTKSNVLRISGTLNIFEMKIKDHSPQSARSLYLSSTNCVLNNVTIIKDVFKTVLGENTNALILFFTILPSKKFPRKTYTLKTVNAK